MTERHTGKLGCFFLFVLNQKKFFRPSQRKKIQKSWRVGWYCQDIVQYYTLDKISWIYQNLRGYWEQLESDYSPSQSTTICLIGCHWYLFLWAIATHGSMSLFLSFGIICPLIPHVQANLISKSTSNYLQPQHISFYVDHFSCSIHWKVEVGCSSWFITDTQMEGLTIDVKLYLPWLIVQCPLWISKLLDTFRQVMEYGGASNIELTDGQLKVKKKNDSQCTS